MCNICVFLYWLKPLAQCTAKGHLTLFTTTAVSQHRSFSSSSLIPKIAQGSITSQSCPASHPVYLCVAHFDQSGENLAPPKQDSLVFQLDRPSFERIFFATPLCLHHTQSSSAGFSLKPWNYTVFCRCPVLHHFPLFPDTSSSSFFAIIISSSIRPVVVKQFRNMQSVCVCACACDAT